MLRSQLNQPRVNRTWLETVNRIKVQVSQYKAQARLEYIRKHGTPHPAEARIAEVTLCQETQPAE